jgi:dienelactone hydrolase
MLWKMYDPESAPYAFRASTVSEAVGWQEKTRPALADLVGFQDLPKADPEARILEEVQKDGYLRQKIIIKTSAGTAMPVYILLPEKAARPLPMVLAFHGHGYGVKSIVGINEDGTERDQPEGYQKDFAVELCRRGFAVAAPEISCFGERRTLFSFVDRQAGYKPPKTCKHTAFLSSHLGGSALGLRVMDSRRLIDYLQSRPELDCSRLGAMGISGGGMLTFYTAALDERIKACVVSGYFCTFRHSILSLSHCACNYVAGLGRFGEMSDIAGLIAPRPMLVEAGTTDPIFPFAAVETAVAEARKVYGVFGAEEAVKTDFFEGPHQLSGAKAYDFLAECLEMPGYRRNR